MAVINKLRNSGIVIIVIIFALAAFIIGDLLSNYQKANAQAANENTIALIDGESVEYGEYQVLYNEYEGYQKLNTQGAPLESYQIQQVKEQAWKQLFNNRVIYEEYSNLGLSISKEELNDLIFSTTPHPSFEYYFTPLMAEEPNQAYNPAKVKQWLDQILGSNPEARDAYFRLENQVKEQVVEEKYNAMLKNSIYTTSLEAERSINDQLTNISGKIVSLEFSAIEDDKVEVSDAELQEYLNDHPEEFEQEGSADFRYIKWDILPESKDSQDAKTWADNAYDKFKNTPNDSVYLQNNSLVGYDSTYKTMTYLPKEIATQIETISPGEMVGPVYSNGQYNIYKVLDIKDDSLWHMRASHILIKFQTPDKEAEAKTKANKILADIKRGTVSWEDAVKDSEDFGSVPNGGDIGWFPETGAVVEEFSNFALTHSKGQMGVTKSQFGFHIIKVTEHKTKKIVRFGSVSQNIVAGKETRRKVLNKASEFRRTMGSGENAFENHLDKMSLIPSIARKVSEINKVVNGVPESKELTKWVFDSEREDGDVSPVLLAGNSQFVLELIKKREKGVAEVDDVREELTVKVKNLKRANMHEEAMKKAIAESGSMEEIAIALKTIAQPLEQYNISNPEIPWVGADNILRGYLIGSKEGKIIGPIVGDAGVHVFMLSSVSTDAIEVNMVDEEKNRLTTTFQQGVGQYVFETLQELANLEDFRYKFDN
jgi:peptidyl-prolyl cis-trans isomerase D